MKPHKILPLDYEDYAHIYCLINPLNDQVFYVGATMHDLSQRLHNHIQDGKKKKTLKALEIAKILAMGKKPEILLLETAHVEDATFFENFYMELFRSYGFALCQMRKSYYSKGEYKKSNWRDDIGEIFKTGHIALERVFEDCDWYKICRMQEDEAKTLYEKFKNETLSYAETNRILSWHNIFELKNMSYIKYDSSSSKSHWIRMNFRYSEYELAFPYNRYNVERLNLKSA